MQAMHGSARPVRSRGRLIGCSMALVLALGALFASTASAKAPATQSYLALGDSLAFGYSQQLFNENEKTGEPASAFENGYTNVYLKYANKQNPTPYQLINNGCPGETTDSFIGNGPLGAALEASPFAAHGEAPCAYHYTERAPGFFFPLHHEYGGSKSQLESALETIAVQSFGPTPVTKVSFNIGANDELRQVKACEKEVGEEYGKEGKSKYGANPTEAVENCLKAHVKELIEHIVKNTAASVYTLRHGSEFGGIDYTGKIVFQAGYDPYGNLVPNGEPQIENGKEQKELLPGSVPLAKLINAEVANAVNAYGGAETCIANPLPRFNPISEKSGIKILEKEEFRLQTWTNMANTTEFEGKKNGPDIHPTPTGYKQLASIMRKACGV
jgi:hypothetical protein